MLITVTEKRLIMDKRPRSKFEDKDGIENLDIELTSEKDFPQVIEWNKKYAVECDRLATIEAQNNHTSWGRWYIDDGYLSTWVCFPAIENNPVRKCYVYDFDINRAKTLQKQDWWIEHMKEKRWMGEQGIKDLKRAFKYLLKHSRSGKIKLVNEIEKE
jgi:hypothetical protein